MISSCFIKIGRYLAIVMLAVVPVVASQGKAYAQSAGDPDQHVRELQKKRDALRAEQEYLLFRKVFYESDSKYLVLDISAGKGYLMYRSRILRSFNLERTGRRMKDPSHGIITMTAKTDGASRNRMLLFGNTLSLHAKKNEVKGGNPVGYRVGRRDLAALFYALETGSKAYVK